MDMKYVPAKTIVTRAQSPEQWFGMDYNMNIYRGCCHGCIYCDSRSECYHIENFDEVRAKENALEKIESELKTKRKTGVIATGAMSDPYNPYEKLYCLTRGALKLIDRHGFGVAVATKSDLAARDIDILKSISSHSPVIIKVTITASDDELCKKVEPHAPVSSRRFSAIKSLSDAGIFAGVLLMPVLPFIEDSTENIIRIAELASESGARFVYPAFGVTLRQNQRDYFYRCLDRDFPGVKGRYMRQYGNEYKCTSPNYRELWHAFAECCSRLGLLYHMQDIIKAYRGAYDGMQISLFYQQ
jgi:DNA repair photolyase